MSATIDSATLIAIGEALYGPRWQTALAADLGVSDRTMRRWVSGGTIPAGVREDLLEICRRRQVDLAAIIDMLGAAA